jgi:hypothetical protein
MFGDRSQATGDRKSVEPGTIICGLKMIAVRGKQQVLRFAQDDKFFRKLAHDSI